MEKEKNKIAKAVRQIEAGLQNTIQSHSSLIGVRTLAREIGVSPTTISLINNGHVPDFTTLRKIADWLDP